MTGLLSQGVPKQLKNTIYTFEYNNINQLENLLKTKKNIGTIKLEVSRRPKAKSQRPKTYLRNPHPHQSNIINLRLVAGSHPVI